MIGTATKRQKITLAARELFLLQSYEKTTMEEIARAVPMSKATLYTEFSNKEEILLEICRNHIDEMNSKMCALVEASEENCLSTLKSMLLTAVEGIYHVTESLRSPETLMFESNRLQTLLLDRTEKLPEIVGKLIEKAKRNGEVHAQTDCSSAATTVLYALTSFLPPYIRHFNKPGRPDLNLLKADLSAMLELICDGFRYQSKCGRSI